MRRQRHDVVVIGAGTAGLTAGARLAEAGARVCVIAKGIGSTHLAPATIDVLGYAPQRVESPWEAIPEFAAAHPGHPYALLGRPLLAEAVSWFGATAAAGESSPYGYVGSLDRNLLLPTAVGALKPSALVPETFAAGDLHQLGSVAVVGIRALRDFHPELCAANLEAVGVDARGLLVDVELGRADESALGVARQFEDATWRAGFAGRLAPLLGTATHVGLPALLGSGDAHTVHRDLEARLERRVFEIPTLPPSVPGMRLFEILHRALRAAGGRLVIGAGVVSHRRSAGRVLSVDTATAGSNTTYEADAFVLASGGFHSGAIALDSRWRAIEQVLDLALTGVPEPGAPRFVPSYFDEQPLSRCGVAVDSELRAPGAPNVVVAGASLPGSVPWREGSGEGIALASGYRAAQVLGAPAATEAAA